MRILLLVILVGSLVLLNTVSKSYFYDKQSDISPLVLTIGGFRNIVSDIMMARLQYLIENNDIEEVEYLSEFVSELNPDSPKITIFNAWNLAYNISLIVPDKKSRWYFLNKAIRLLSSALTDEDTKANAELRYELAILYMNKLSNISKEEAFFTEMWIEEYNLKRNYLDNLETFEKLKMDIDTIKTLETIYGPQDWTTSLPYIRYNAYMAKNKIGDRWQENIRVLLK